MNTTNNILSNKAYLISPELHTVLENNTLNNSAYKNKGLYVIKLNKSSPEKIVYSYMYYNYLFKDSLLYYMYSRHDNNNLMKEDINQNLFLIDNRLKFDIINTKGIKLAGVAFNSAHDMLLCAVKDFSKDRDLKRLNNVLHRINYYTSIEEIEEILLYAMKGEHYLILDTIFSSIISELKEDEENTTNNTNTIMYEDLGISDLELKEYNKIVEFDNKKLYKTINNCVIVCNDIKSFVLNLKERGIEITQGSKCIRGEVNETKNYLSTLDYDYRNSLFHHHRYHIKSNRYFGVPSLLRKDFSYKNIHMNLGTVRNYSTTNRYYSDNKKRQDLFQENYEKITNIINDNPNLSLVDIQKSIELFLQNQENNFLLETSKFNKLTFNSKSYNLLSEKRNNIKKLLNKNVFKGIKDKDNIEKYKKIFIETIGVDLLSNLLISLFLEILNKETITTENGELPGIPSMHVWEIFGRKLVRRYIYILYKNSKTKESLSLFKEKNKDDFYIFDDTEENFNAKIGGYFVHSLKEVDLLDEEPVRVKKNSKENVLCLRIHSDVRSILIADKDKYIHIPQKLPMLCEPKDFEYSLNIQNNKLGGYLLNDVYYTDQIFKNKRGYEETTKLSKDNIVVSLINGMSKVPYKINTETLEFIEEYGIEKEILIDDSDKNFQKYIENPYKSFNVKDKNEFRSLLSKKILEKNIISIAKTFSQVEKIYFPLRLDQRTRIYCETDYFDYQKIDLAKGLILFSRPGYITKLDDMVIKYYKSYGANMYGNGLDKKSINSRCKWVDDNKENILNFRDNKFINQAENKCCFVSFCLEYEKFIKFMNSTEDVMFNTYLPIQLDASCNGYQHLALLTKETKLFDKLNLSESSIDDSPDDFYKYIVEKTNNYIEEKISFLSKKKEITEKEEKTLKSLLILEKVSFDRSIVKKTIMTKSYNASIPKQIDNIIKNLKEHFEDKKRYYIYKNENIRLTRSDISTFVMQLKEVLDLESPKIKELSKYLNSIVLICTKLQLPVPWNLPTGAMIKESYQKQEELSVKAFSFVKSRYTFKKYVKGTLDLRKQKRATMPNLIHSLDASTIALLYKEFIVMGDLYTVHDCFATTVDNVPLLMDILKSVYLELYSSEDYLKQFDMLVRLNINKQYGNSVLNLNDNSVNIPNGSKLENTPFPDINKVLNINKLDRQKVNNLVKSSYTLI